MKKLAMLALVLLLSGGVWWLLRSSSPGGADVVRETRPAPITPLKSPITEPKPTVISAAAAPAMAPAPEPALSSTKPAKPGLADLLQAGHRIHDAMTGLSVTYPADWTAREAVLRWGVNEGENTIFFSPPDGSQAVPSLYYRRYSDGPAFDMTNPEATLRDMAQQKETSRSAGGQNDYKNDPGSFVFRTIDGNPTLSYFATYTNRGEVHAEYFLRMLGPSGYVMFFNRGPVKDVQALIPTIVEMAGTVKPP